jgi:polyferredoxin
MGSLQDEQVKLSNKKIDLPRALNNIKYVILFLVIIFYFWILDARRNPIAGNVYDFMFKDTFTIAIWSFAVALGVFATSFFVHRFWCNYLCPIGTASELLIRMENKILRRI